MQEIQGIIVRLQQSSDLNRLTRLDNSIIFEEPLIGIADGYDPLFALYKTVIGDFHLTPEEIILDKKQKNDLPYIADELSVVCWVLPFAKHIKTANAHEEIRASIKWVHAQGTGEAFNNLVRKTMQEYFTSRSILASAPVLPKGWISTERSADNHSFNWSERHALYAAGLGTFSINGGFITEKGMAMCCGSIVVNKRLPVTERTCTDHRENCLFVSRGICGKCMKRCPASAITAQGHDKEQCRRYRDKLSIDFLRTLPDLDIRADFCGLCQTGTPCESANPMKKAVTGV